MFARVVCGVSVWCGVWLAACSSQGNDAPGDPPDGPAPGQGGGSSGAPGDPAAPPAPEPVDPPTELPTARCAAPLERLLPGNDARTVGDGSTASCTEASLRDAVAAGGFVRFDCGEARHVIALSAPLRPPLDRDTVIDGDGRIALDGQGRTRLLEMVRDNYRSSDVTLTLQRLELRGGKAPEGGYVAPSTSQPACAHGYAEGAGGAVLVRDSRLHVLDSVFLANQAASPGPDVGGGAIYALGSRGVVVSGSHFQNNQGANGGAIGMLQTELTVVNSRFVNNQATGEGANYAGGDAAGCPGVGHAEQGGAGGNGGAIAIDGSSDVLQRVCGCEFTLNHGNAHGGALFRTANHEGQPTEIERSYFHENESGRSGGALYINQAKPLRIHGSSFVRNRAPSGGMAQLDRCELDVVNTTIAANVATSALGGGLFNGGSTGTLRNVTFAYNQTLGGSGHFAAAIAGSLTFAVHNSVFYQNETDDAGSPMTCWFAPGPGAHNLQWPTTHKVGSAPDPACTDGTAFADAKLGELELVDGGAVARPGAGSAALGVGQDCPSEDQLGTPRPSQGCAAGAVER